MSEYINIPFLGSLLAFLAIIMLLAYFNKPTLTVAATPAAVSTTA